MGFSAVPTHSGSPKAISTSAPRWLEAPPEVVKSSGFQQFGVIFDETVETIDLK
jgi:hypothetical protein